MITFRVSFHLQHYLSLREEAIKLRITLSNRSEPLAHLLLIRVVIKETWEQLDVQFLREGERVERCRLCLINNTVVWAGEAWVWMRVRGHTNNVLYNVVATKDAPPAMGSHVVEDEASAWIGHVATNDARWQDRAVLLDVPQRDVVHIDERLSITGHKWVQEAARVIVSARLVLLLWTDVD